MVYEDGVLVRFEYGDKAMVIACPDESLRSYWNDELNEYIGKQVTIRDTLRDSDGYFYRLCETSLGFADHRFLVPFNPLEILPEKENENELSQPQISSFLNCFKVV